MKQKITVITLQNIRNYGSALQALATQEVMKQIGLEVDFINYARKGSDSVISRVLKYSKGKSLLVRLFSPVILVPTFVIQDLRFKRFLKKYLNQQDTVVHNNEDCKKLPITSNIYCTGSDQTWNSGWNGGILPELFLEFVPDGVKKIAYSASMGKSQLEDWEKAETKRLLSRYAAISVRESSAVDIISDLGLPMATHVLDPTLQMNRKFWLEQAGERKVQEPYVLIYQLNSNGRFDRYAVEYAKCRGLKLIRFCTRFDQMRLPGKAIFIPQVLDFANLIAYADTVITDSFHATAFSINMNTPFISIYPGDYSSRLASILELTDLQHRHLSDYNDFSFVDKTMVDFTHANKVLEEQREIGWNFLKQAIHG